MTGRTHKKESIQSTRSIGGMSSAPSVPSVGSVFKFCTVELSTDVDSFPAGVACLRYSARAASANFRGDAPWSNAPNSPQSSYSCTLSNPPALEHSYN